RCWLSATPQAELPQQAANRDCEAIFRRVAGNQGIDASFRGSGKQARLPRLSVAARRFVFVQERRFYVGTLHPQTDQGLVALHAHPSDNGVPQSATSARRMPGGRKTF